jgi:hypothetical protein
VEKEVGSVKLMDSSPIGPARQTSLTQRAIVTRKSAVSQSSDG